MSESRAAFESESLDRYSNIKIGAVELNDLRGTPTEISNVIASVYPIKDVFYADMTFGILFFTLIFGTFVSVLSSLYPAYRAVKIDPVKALRHI